MSDSFYDRCKTFNRAMPRGLSSGAKHVLNVIFFHSDQEGVSWVGTDTIAEVATMTRSGCFRAMKELADAGVLQDDGWQVHGTFSRTRRRRICLDGASASLRPKRSGQRVGPVEKIPESVSEDTGSPIRWTSDVRSDGSGSSDPVDLGSPIRCNRVVRSGGLGSSDPVDLHIKMNLPGEPKRRTTQENHPGGTEQENRILSEKIRTMDVVGEAIGENSKPAQDSLLSPAEDEALASLRGPTKATTRKATRRPASDVEGFDEWYDLYARKEARGAAEKAYRKAVKGGVPPAVLLACLRRHLPAMQRKIAAGERQYVPYPASWLNAERWADGLSNEQKRALCAPGSDVERLLDEALGAGGPSYVLSTANSASDEDLPEVLWNEADGPEPTQRQFYSWIASEYPNKSDATLGFEAFLKLAPSLSLFHKMRMAIDVQKKSIEWRSSHGKLIPTFADWIEQRRWNDRLTPDPEATKILVPGGF